MSHDVPYSPYVPHADMWYLCGFAEPFSAIACVKRRGGEAYWHLFVKPNCPEEELWEGALAGVQGAKDHILPEGSVHSISDSSAVLRAACEEEGIRLLLVDQVLGKNQMQLEATRSMLDVAAARSLLVASPKPYVEQLRVRKSAAEAKLMQGSASAAAAAFRQTMAASRVLALGGVTEAALAATFEYECRLRGAERLAYPCVVASGDKAVTLHYMHNNKQLVPGELLLMDAGCSKHGYASDITRTWPLSGTYSQAQAALYAAVLDVNKKCINAVAHGETLTSLHHLSVRLTYEHLRDLNILQDASRLQRYYPHAIGHWLGIDVHDTSCVPGSTPLRPGMVITIEPGLYFPSDDESVPAWCRGIGIRIEDDVLVNSDGVTVLTAHAPKEIDHVESAVQADFQSTIKPAQHE